MKIFLLYIFMMVMIGCRERNFDEREYMQRIDNQKNSDLYQKNYDGEVYYNPWNKSTKSFKDVLRWRFTPARDYEIGDREYLPESLEVDIESIAESKNYIIWLGHMSYLVNVEDDFYLLDPVFNDRVLIPKRYVEPPMTMEEIYTLIGDRDLVVLVTHNHYDHLDKETLKELREGTKIYVSKGDEDLVATLGDFDVRPMEWWDSEEGITFVPAQHWSRRIGKKRNSSLWGSFVLEKEEFTLFLGGDSGYFRGFEEIGNLYSIDYAIVSVGAYEPRWFMYESHLDIDESIKVIDDMKIKNKMIPGHWGTFKLGDEPPGYPKYEYSKINDERVEILDMGEIFYLETSEIH